MATVEGVSAGSGDDSAGEFMAAASVGFRQFGEVRLPAELNGVIRVEVTGGSQHCGNDCRHNRHHHGEEEREKNDVSNRPMESINPRKHLCSLLLAARTGAG